MKHMYPFRQYLFIAMFFLFSGMLSAQTFVMSNAPINSCAGFFYDPGGAAGNYGPNQNFSTTICPAGGTGTHVQLVFSAPQLGPGDQLCFFDGPTVAAPPLSCAADFEAGQPFIIQATAVNPGGCLTVTFTSDGNGEGAGWSADINCVASCQIIQAELVSSDPAVMPVDIGWIDVCPGERVFFTGRGNYPQNGAIYNHSDLTSSFQWTFGDGGVAVGPNVSYVFEEPGGYIVQMIITDQFGCKNTNFLTQRVRVSTQPDFNIGGNLASQICVGDTITLNAAVDTLDANYVFSVVPMPGSFQSGGIRSDSLPLPDGTGAAFTTSIGFTDFSPGQALTNINDLLGICVNMEHSWLHDLEINLTCPSGQTAILHNFISPPTTGGAGETRLGIPFDPDPAGDPNAINTPWGVIVPGTGWDYCWTPTATRGTWRQFATNNNPGTLPTGDYNSFQPLTNLLGCPLNGEWTITVIDRWGADNGFIFNWSINFASDLYPNLETFTPEIVSYSWENNPSIIFQASDSIVAVPSSAGTASYTFMITDNFGCTYDTSININVLPFTHPDCYDCIQNVAELRDTTICSGQSVSLNASPGSLDADVPFTAYPYAPFGFSTNPPANPFNSTINVSSIRPLTLTNPAQQIVSICIDIETDWCSDLRIFLRAPNGVLFELSTTNGGGGDNYTNTCFTPTAVTSIVSGAPPFTGNFRPEGNWNILSGAPINGNWTLVASDAFGFNDIGRINSWSITFRSTNTVNYTWTPSTGLSCVNCPNPTATPAVTTTYNVQSLDVFNCTYSEMVTINVVDNIPAPTVVCGSQGAGQITFSWTPVAGYTQYEYREIINGTTGPWQGPVTALTHNVNNLMNTDDVTLEVRVYLPPAAVNCPIAVGSAMCIYETCTLSAALSGSTQDVSCNGLSDGTATVVANGGLQPFEFFLDGSATPLSSGVFNALPAGAHSVLVQDAAQCQVTVNFTINQPPALQANIVQTQAISCHQGSNGALTASAQGGNGGYQFVWSNSGMSATVSALTAGSYEVTVTDQRGCRATATLPIVEPTPVVLQLTPTPIACNGIASGAVLALGTGGVGSFAYSWAHTANTQSQQSALGAGTYRVTATDANGCAISDSVTLTEPALLVVDSTRFTAVRCFGGNDGNASIFVSGGTEPYRFQWNDPAQQLNDTAFFLTARDYAVIVTDANGCTSTADIAVTQPNALQAVLTPVHPLCAAEATGSVQTQVQGGVGNYTYQWSNSQNLATLTAVTEGAYSLTVTDGNGCTFEAQTTLEAPEPLTLGVTQSFRGCFGLSDNEATATAGGGVLPYRFVWSNGAQNAVADNMAPGTYSVTLSDANNCTITGSAALADWDRVTVNIIAEPPTCNGLADGLMGVNIITGGAGGTASDYTFNWSNNASGVIIRNLPGDINYIVTVTDGQGCTGTAERFLTQPAPILFDIASTDALCFGSSDGTATVSNIRGDNVQFSFLWDAATGAQINATATALPVGSYAVTITDEDGCVASGDVAVGQPTDIVLQLDLTQNGCFGNTEGTAKLTATGGTPGYTYSWPGNRTGADISSLAAGAYIATVTDANGCVKNIEAVITQPEPLVAEVSHTDVSCFGGRNGVITVNMSGGTPGFQFSLDNRNFNGANIMVGLRAGQYTIYVKDAKGCTLLTEAGIAQPDEFIVDAGPASHTIALGDSVVLNATAINAQGDVEYVWSAAYGNTLSCTECAVTVARPGDQIAYELYAVDARGCESTDLVTIFVEKERIALVPTGFTPNNDGVNDRLLVHGRTGTRILFFRVYDRWGQLLYDGGDFLVNDEAFGWDGYFRGGASEAGVYLWHLEVEYPDGVKERHTGQTTLIR